jgi:ribosome biogenesis GTPase / thiamine phosphate phosphatase
MTHDSLTLRDLGWSPFLQAGLNPDDLVAGEPVRVAAVHRTGVDALAPDGPRRLTTGPALPTSQIAVGDWLLVERVGGRVLRRLERKSLIARRAAGTGQTTQAIAANLDTLFVVSSCNADFNVARLERFLALARQASVMPVVVLTKADACAEPEAYVDRVRALSAALPVEAVNALDPASVARLVAWCGRGETVALAGSSGVGKSTLTNALTGAALATRGIREDDAHGRHTTTVRSLHRTRAGGWLIDTPGMRALRLIDVAEGIAAVFDDITALGEGCRFGDCGHDGEPGCAVQAAIDSGALDPDRLARWRKLAREDARNTATLAESRARSRAQGRFFRSVKRELKRRKG